MTVKKQQDENMLLFKSPTLHSWIVSPFPSIQHIPATSPMVILAILYFHFTLTPSPHNDSHFTGCKLRRVHSVSFFYQFVEFGIHRHTSIWTVSCIRGRDSVTLNIFCKHTDSYTNIHTAEKSAYLVRRFPKAKCRRTTRHSQRCTRTQRYFQETSTSLEDGPEEKSTQWLNRKFRSVTDFLNDVWLVPGSAL